MQGFISPEVEFIIEFHKKLRNNQSLIFNEAENRCMSIVTTYDKDELLDFAERNYKSVIDFSDTINELCLNDSWLDLNILIESYELLIELLNKYGNSSNKSCREEKDCCRVLFDLINNAYILSYKRHTKL